MAVIRSNVAALVGPEQVTLTLDFAPSQDAVAATYLDLATAVIPVGAPVELVGRLSTQSSRGVPRAPVAGRSVEIQSLLAQTEAIVSSSEGPLSALTTDAAGGFSAEFAPLHNLLIRALASDAPAVASPLLVIGVRPAVTLNLATQTPLVLMGQVTPPKPRLELQISAGAGKPAHSRTEVLEVAADGSFSVRPRLAAGSYSVRAVSPADALNLSGASARLELTVA